MVAIERLVDQDDASVEEAAVPARDGPRGPGREEQPRTQPRTRRATMATPEPDHSAADVPTHPLTTIPATIDPDFTSNPDPATAAPANAAGPCSRRPRRHPRRREQPGARLQGGRRRPAVHPRGARRPPASTEDGAALIDYVGSWGPAILGHAHPAVVEAVDPGRPRRPQLRRAARAAEVELAELLCRARPGAARRRGPPGLLGHRGDDERAAAGPRLHRPRRRSSSSTAATTATPTACSSTPAPARRPSASPARPACPRRRRRTR